MTEHVTDQLVQALADLTAAQKRDTELRQRIMAQQSSTIAGWIAESVNGAKGAVYQPMYGVFGSPPPPAGDRLKQLEAKVAVYEAALTWIRDTYAIVPVIRQKARDALEGKAPDGT